jgi:signal peptidase II
MFSLHEDNRPLKLALWAAVIAAAVALDQYTKYLAVAMLKPIGSYPLWQDVFHLTYVENTGAAFGILRDRRWIFMVLSAVAVVAIIVYLIVKSSQTPIFAGIALSLIAAGGIGNMIDRIKVGYVVDFFDFTLIDFAVFNVADSCVTVGSVLMILYMIATEIKAAKERETEMQADNKQS